MTRSPLILPTMGICVLMLSFQVAALPEEEAGKEDEKASPVDIAISCMLCGCIFFIMMIFYLVNYPDDDIKYYAWSVISTTISIFTAVLMYKGIESVFARSYFDDLDEVQNVVAKYGFFVLWFLVLQVVVMMMAGVFGLPSHLKARKCLMLKSWRTLLAHMVAFASLGAGTSLQELGLVSYEPRLVFATVGAHFFVLSGLLVVSAQLRICIGRYGYEHAVEVWSQEVEDAENDIVALSVSFLLVQALRFAISGVLPDPEGLEIPQDTHPFRCTLLLFAAALGFAVLVILLVCAGSGGRLEDAPKLKRVLVGFRSMSAMVLAWCSFYAGKWELKRMAASMDPNSMTSAVLLALMLSAASFATIFVFDWLEDLESTGREFDRALVSIISALGILVGFSWEQSFEGALSRLASLTEHPSFTKLGLAFVVVLIVVPAWRKYILTTTVKAEAVFLNSPGKFRSRVFDEELRDELEGFSASQALHQILRKSSEELCGKHVNMAVDHDDAEFA